MAKLKISISSIFEGQAPSFAFGSKGQYQVGIGIDPDMPLTDDTTDLKTGGAIRPVNYTAFSDTTVTSYPVSILTTPKNTNVYTYQGIINRHSRYEWIIKLDEICT